MELLKKWFAESAPTNAKSATGTLTISGVVADAQTVTIGSEIYEFKTSGNAGAGKIKVDVSGGVTASAAVTALVTAITANSTIVTAVDGTGDTVVVTAKLVGTEGNSIASTKVMTNGSWGVPTTLEGGQMGTPCPIPFTYVTDTTYIYTNIAPNTIRDANWRRFQLTEY